MAKRFQVIRDSELTQNKAELAQMLRDKLKDISAALSNLSGVSFIVEEFYLIKSEMSEQDFQWRATCYVEKDNRKLSWSDVYWAINTIYIPRYESVSKQQFQSLAEAQNNDIHHLKSNLGTHFSDLVHTPIDDVDSFINKGLTEHATNRTFAGFEGIQAVGKLKTLMTMTREQVRQAAVIEVNSLISAA